MAVDDGSWRLKTFTFDLLNFIHKRYCTRGKYFPSTSKVKAISSKMYIREKSLVN